MDWTKKTFYHGSDVPDFDAFDPKKIGSAHDSGWYGKGFYFAFTFSEAAYYGKYVRKATLDIRNPFFFEDEIRTLEDQNPDIFGDLAVFALNMKKKFPELANRIKLKTIPNLPPRTPIYITLSEYADEIEKIYGSEDLKLFEGRNGKKSYWSYRWGNDYNKFRFRVDDPDYARKNRISVAAQYVNDTIYGMVDGHSPEHYLSAFAEEFSRLVQEKGYDGIIQSPDGDEALCFKPEQIHWL